MHPLRPGFNPLTAGLHQPAPAPGPGWVSFDDGPSVGAAPAFPAPQPQLAQAPMTSGMPGQVPGILPPAAGGLGTATSFSPLTTAANKSTFPTFAALHASIAQPQTAAATTQPAIHPFSGLPAAAPVVVKPAAVGGSGAAVHANPFAASANPQGATAAARSNDPFASLAMSQPPARPPPMGASSSRRHVTDPFAAAEAPPAFPTFAAIHGQAPPPPQPHSALTPQPASTGSPSPLPVFPAFAAAPHLPPQGAALAAGPPASNVQQPASVDAASFDAFVSSALRPVPAPLAPVGAAAAAVVTPPPPPPAYTAALSMSPAAGTGPAPPPPPTYDDAVGISTLPLPPPPAYTDALAMPEAPSLGVDGSGVLTPPLPPPGYDEARVMPSADSSGALPNDVSLTGLVQGRPLPGARAQGPSGLAMGSLGSAVVSSGAEENWASFGSEVHAAPHLTRQMTHATAAVAEVPLPRPPPTATFGPGGAALMHSGGVHLSHAVPPPPPPMAPPPLPKQVTIEVRLAPLKPKEAALPVRLVAGMGNVFAAPGGEGVSALQWMLWPLQPPAGAGGSGPHGPVVDGALPLAYQMPAGGKQARDDGGSARAGDKQAVEDWDSAPAAMLFVPPSCEAAVTCMLLDEQSGSLWTGGCGRSWRWGYAGCRAINAALASWQRVCSAGGSTNAWAALLLLAQATRMARLRAGASCRAALRSTSTTGRCALAARNAPEWTERATSSGVCTACRVRYLASSPYTTVNLSALLLLSVQAHAYGKVTSLVLTPWGELWTASSSGSVRAWQYLAAIPGARSGQRAGCGILLRSTTTATRGALYACTATYLKLWHACDTAV